MRLRRILVSLLISLLGGVASAEVPEDEAREAQWRSAPVRQAGRQGSELRESDLRAWVLQAGATATRPALLGPMVGALSPLERTRLVASWATSPDPRLRLALARALAYPFDAVGLPSAVQVLLVDPRPEVRGATRGALRVRPRGETLLAYVIRTRGRARTSAEA